MRATNLFQKLTAPSGAFLPGAFLHAILASAILFTAPAAPLNAQQAAAEQAENQRPEQSVKVLRVSQDAEQIAALLDNFDVSVRTSQHLGLITIAGRPENVAQAEQAVREIEKLTTRTRFSAAQDVDLTVHFLEIVNQDTTDIPASLREVVAELKKTFPFQGYKLMETIALRARVGNQGASVEGLIPEELGSGALPKQYRFQVQLSSIEAQETSSLIRFSFVRASIRFPLPTNDPAHPFRLENVEIKTALEVADGKTVVVGKAGASGESQGYLLVMTARVVK
jgi:hypothetical protein